MSDFRLARRFQVFSDLPNIFALEPSLEKKATLCQTVSQLPPIVFEMAEKKAYIQDKHTDIFIFIIVEICKVIADFWNIY